MTPLLGINQTFSRPRSPYFSLRLCDSNISIEERHNILCKVISSDSHNQVAEHIPHFTASLRRLIPERHDGELSTKVQQLFDPCNKDPLRQIFELVAYFSSNNQLTPDQIDVFLKWIINGKYADGLKSFLQIDTPTIHALRVRILEAGI